MKVIRSAADAKGEDFLVIDDFLSAEGCDRLSATYRNSADFYETWHKESFWQGRLLGHRDVTDFGAIEDMRRSVDKARVAVEGFYNAQRLYTDALHVVGWPQGWQMPPHADNAHESGEQHEFHWRDYSGVLYLNGDFDGGGLYLPKQDILIQPPRGMFVSLPCGLSHMHGVTEVTLGLRITLAFFLTADYSHVDPDLLDWGA